MPAAVFASGGGTNFQALLDVERRGAAFRTKLLVSDRDDAEALERASGAGVDTRVIPVRGRETSEVLAETRDALGEAGVQIVFLAGYLRPLPAALLSAFPRRILNIHPALLPAFGGRGMYGRRVHQAVLASGARVSGATVHYVDERYDEGAILAQWPVPVRSDDTPETLAARVLEVEHRLYPLAAEHVSLAIQRGGEAGVFDPPGAAFTLVGGERTTSIETHFEAAFPQP